MQKQAVGCPNMQTHSADSWQLVTVPAQQLASPGQAAEAGVKDRWLQMRQAAGEPQVGEASQLTEMVDHRLQGR